MSGLKHYVENSEWQDLRIDQTIHIFTEIHNLNEESEFIIAARRKRGFINATVVSFNVVLLH
jgi:hypothetical protein